MGLAPEDTDVLMHSLASHMRMGQRMAWHRHWPLRRTVADLLLADVDGGGLGDVLRYHVLRHRGRGLAGLHHHRRAAGLDAGVGNLWVLISLAYNGK